MREYVGSSDGDAADVCDTIEADAETTEGKGVNEAGDAVAVLLELKVMACTLSAQHISSAARIVPFLLPAMLSKLKFESSGCEVRTEGLPTDQHYRDPSESTRRLVRGTAVRAGATLNPSPRGCVH